MKLRRLEIAVLTITLAFAFFMAGYFTGRNQKSSGLTTTAVHQNIDASRDIQITAIEPPPDTQQQNTLPVQTIDMPETQTQVIGIPKEDDGKININSATHGELTDLPGIGNTLATRIIEYRTQNGGFSKIEDIRNVSGIGERRYEAIMDYIKVG